MWIDSELQKPGKLATLAFQKGWAADTFTELLAAGRYGEQPDAKLVSKLRRLTSLLPPSEIPPLTLGALKVGVPKYKPDPDIGWTTERLQALTQLRVSGRFDDEHVLAVWPARTKMDLAIRRSRLRDTYGAYKKAGLVEQFWNRAALLGGFDAISVCNLLNAGFLLTSRGFDWFEFYAALGAFTGGIEHYTAVAKYVNDQAKKYPVQGFPRRMVVESGVMTGFRNPPYPGFSVLHEAEKLAKGLPLAGARARPGGMATFRRLAEKTLRTTADRVEWISFRDYITSGEWETAGSSTEGVVHWKWGEESGKFKARKNMVPDVVDLEELADACAAFEGQLNKTLIKSELGKIRLAVSSDLYTYLKMSWLTRLMGKCYLRWPGSTIEEDSEAQTDRMIRMLKAICAAWNLPFDYAAYDHQPSTEELLIMMDQFVAVARTNVAPGNSEEFDRVVASIRNGFHVATLSARDGEDAETFRVTGGLMSGLRWTTLMGNAWNTVITAWVKELLAEAGQDMESVEAWVRGDDSAIVTPSYATTLAFRVGYDLVGAEGSDGKFGIHEGRSEFLRVEYSDEGCNGYATRAIPNLTQRKPWNSAPWTEESTMEHIFAAITVLRRRGADGRRLDQWWSSSKEVWSRRKKVSTGWLGVPRSLGGLGIEPWDGVTVPTKGWPKTELSGLEVTNQTDWRALKIQASMPTRLNVTLEESRVLAQQHLADKIASDDVPQVNSVLRQRAQLPDAPLKTVQDFVMHAKPMEVTVREAKRLRGASCVEGMFRSLSNYGPTRFGVWSYLANEFDAVSKVFALRSARGVVRWFMAYCPGFGRDLSWLERHGFSRSAALDWLFGKTSFGVLRVLHPALSELVSVACVRTIETVTHNLKWDRVTLEQFKSKIFQIYEEALVASELSRKVYRW